MYSIPEVNCGLICGCLPILPAFLQHLRAKLPSFSLSHNSSQHQPKPTHNSAGGRFLSSHSHHTFRRGAQRLDGGNAGISDLELNEVGLGMLDGIGGGKGKCYTETEVSSRDPKDGGGVRLNQAMMQKDCIWKKVDIEQHFRNSADAGGTS